MTAAIALAILAIACCGYLTLLCSWPLRVHALRSDSQRLIYLSSLAGFGCLILTFVLFALLPAPLRTHGSILALTFKLDYLDQFFWSFLLGPLLACLFNAVALARRWQNGESYTSLRERMLLDSLQRSGDVLMPLLVRCFERNTLLQVNLKSRKVYCGVIVTRPLAIWRSPSHISLLPKFSTVRNKDTLNWERTKTEYPAFEKYTLAQRLNVLKTGLDFLAAEPAKAHVAHELEAEYLQIEEILAQFEDLNVDDWTKLIPVEQIETISPFDELAYERWFATRTVQDSTG